MRTALLTSTLVMVAAMAWAEEQSPPPVKTDAAAAETTPAKPAEPAAVANDTTTASIATDETKKLDFKPPAGYKPKRINGEQVWCAKVVVLGSRFPQQDCRNEAELRELIRNRESMRDDMGTRSRACTSNNGGCGLN